jgi:O-acetyl-ADP-ribose deacetylase (regulator of RNase III)
MKALLADITKMGVDAIVNAANSTLLGGGGVDGAIHRVAGPELLAECRTLGGCETGGAKMTKGYRLPARYVIHTVGPVWKDGASGEAGLLRQCYLNALALAQKNGFRSVAFPCVSTGVYGYPPEKAAEIAVQACREYVRGHHYDCRITFCCFSNEDLEIYHRVLSEGKIE